MTHLLSNITEDFSANMDYAKKEINMWAQVCEIQEPRTPNTILSNLCLIFYLSQGSTQETQSYLGSI